MKTFHVPQQLRRLPRFVCLLIAIPLAASSIGQFAQAQQPSYPCWRGANGSGAGPDWGKPLVADIAQARVLWESAEKRMSGGYTYLEGGIGGIAVADGRVYSTYAYPGGESDPELAAKFLAFYKRAEKAPANSRENAALRAALGTTGYTLEEYAAVMARPKMHDVIICINAETGATIWKKTYPTWLDNLNGRPEGRRGLAPEGVSNWGPFTKPKDGPHNVPCVAYGKVAVIGTTGMMYCLDAATGEEVWKREMVKPGKPNEIPGLTAASVLYGSGNFIALGQAMEAATGKEVWTAKVGGQIGAQGPVRFTHGGRDLLMYGGTCVDAATGTVLWSVEGHSGGGGSATVGEGYLVLSGSYKPAVGARAYRLNADPTKPPVLAWALANEHNFGRHDCTSVIHRGHVYAKMSIGDGLKTAWGCVELATGKMLPQVLDRGNDAHASMIAGDGLIFVENNVFSAAPDFKWLAQPDWFHSGPMYAKSHTAAYVAGRLYIKGENSIRCIDLRSNRK